MMLAMVAALLIAPRPYMAYGPESAVTCAEWTHMRGTTAGEQMQFWLLGFVSGYNYFSPKSDGDVAGGLAASDLIAWANHYCVEHPLDNHVQLGRALIRELERRKKD